MTTTGKSGPEDNLEFYMKFPNPNFKYSGQELADTDYVFVVNEKNLPVVLLLGWAGCQDKYLAKYSALYEDKGLITIRYTAPVNCLFWKRHEMKSIGEKLVRLLLEMNFERNPIIIHVFSNGGAFLYQHISLALQHVERPIQVRGVIFDSAPGERRIITLFRAVSAIIGGNLLYNIPVSICMTMFLCVIWLFETIGQQFKFEKAMSTNPMGNLKDEMFKWPQHFIYSKADNLIPHVDVEKFAAYRKQQGVDVTSLCFDETPHVKHFFFCKERYVNSVCAFVNKCLTSDADYYASTRGRVDDDGDATTPPPSPPKIVGVQTDAETDKEK